MTGNTTPDHGCRDVLRQALRAGVEGELSVTISAVPPIVSGTYVTAPFICPHGVSYWIEPTGEQIAQWVKGEQL